MHMLNFLRLLLLLLLPASISAAAVDRIVYTPGRSGDTTNTSPNLVRRDSVDFGPGDEAQNACGIDSPPEETGGTSIAKLDCVYIMDLNDRSGRYTISGYTGGKWAEINVNGSCTVAVARTNGSTNDFQVGNQDIIDMTISAMTAYVDGFRMHSMRGESVCDAADQSVNFVPIKWKVLNPDDLS